MVIYIQYIYADGNDVDYATTLCSNSEAIRRDVVLWSSSDDSVPYNDGTIGMYPEGCRGERGVIKGHS